MGPLHILPIWVRSLYAPERVSDLTRKKSRDRANVGFTHRHLEGQTPRAEPFIFFDALRLLNSTVDAL